ncbi:MAG TPA: hypothetical protein VJ740_06530, partial [Hyphomicrobiaceae bacterium]|nr:hypothetical protein [Hyphomicrobiaceae bacterium]
ASLVMAYATYRLIEAPGRATIRRQWSQWQQRLFGAACSNAFNADGDKPWMRALAFVGVLVALAAYQFFVIPVFVGHRPL